MSSTLRAVGRLLLLVAGLVVSSLFVADITAAHVPQQAISNVTALHNQNNGGTDSSAMSVGELVCCHQSSGFGCAVAIARSHGAEDPLRLANRSLMHRLPAHRPFESTPEVPPPIVV